MPPSPLPTRIFISYARADLAHFNCLDRHLENLRLELRISTWSNHVLEADETWEPTLLKALHAADILLCLVTPGLMASNFIHDVELNESLARAQREQMRIVPVLVKPTELEGHVLEHFQPLPRGFGPCSTWLSREWAWEAVVADLITLFDVPLVYRAVPQPLPGGYEPMPVGLPPSARLSAKYRVVPFFQALYREALETIQGWVDSFYHKSEEDKRFDLLLVTGAAGTGKTRLLYEVIERRREACWVAGLIQARSELSEQQQLLSEALTVQAPLLVAMDDADACTTLNPLLAWLYEKGTSRPFPVRILLVSRDAGRWWQKLEQNAGNPLWHRLNSPWSLLLDPTLSTQPEPVQPDLFLSSVEHLAESHSSVTSYLPSDLTDLLTAQPIYVYLMALATAERLDPAPSSVAKALCTHEQDSWLRAGGCQEFDAEAYLSLVSCFMAAVTLRGGVSDPAEARQLLAQLQQKDSVVSFDLLALLRQLYPGTKPKWIRPLEPHILGVSLIHQVLRQVEVESYLECVLFDNAPLALTTAFRLMNQLALDDAALGRMTLDTLLAHDLALRAVPALRAASQTGPKGHNQPLTEALLRRLQRGADLALMMQIYEAVPRDSEDLAPLAIWVGDECRRLRQNLSCLDHAGYLFDKGRWLSLLGRESEALAVTEEAVILCREAVLKAGDDCTQELAEGLVLLSTRCRAAGRYAEAAAVAQEAISLFQKRAAGSPESYAIEISLSVDCLAGALSSLRGREGSLDAQLQALYFCEDLAAKSPEAATDWLELVIEELARELSSAGNELAALTARQVVVDFYRVREVRDPEIYATFMGSKLYSLNFQLKSMGRREAALEVSREQVRLRRKQSEKAPGSYSASLAALLEGHSDALRELGRNEEALAALQEAAAILRQLALLSFDVFGTDLARVMTSLAHIYDAMQNHTLALFAFRHAEQLYRHLLSNPAATGDSILSWNRAELKALFGAFCALKSPDSIDQFTLSHRRKSVTSSRESLQACHAHCLIAIGGEFLRQRRWKASLAPLRESVTLYRAQAELEPMRFNPVLAWGLTRLSVPLFETRQYVEALTALQESVALRRTLAAQAPETHAPELAGVLLWLAEELRRRGRGEEAIAANQEAVTLLRTLVAQSATHLIPKLASGLITLAIEVGQLRQRAEAIPLHQEAIVLYRSLVEQSPESYVSELATALYNLSREFQALRRRKEMLAALTEAVVLLTPYVERNPPLYLDDWRLFARTLRKRLRQMGLDPASDPKLTKAMELLGQVEVQRPKR